jgi:outer membrane lipoprotein-sorting protein
MSRSLRNSGGLASLALAWTVAGAAAAEEPPPRHLPDHTPAQWLERMDHALTTRNYDGTFSHWQGGRVEMLRIIHRVQDGTVSERLASLDGSGREFIRTGSSLACYLPDRRTVLVEQRPAEESLVGFPSVNDQTASLYDIREIGHMRLNRRETHVISVSPKDEYRYGYRLWIDDSTAMPLKSQLADAHGDVIEQIVFASLTLTTRIPDSSFRPEISTEGFQWLRDDTVPHLQPGSPSARMERHESAAGLSHDGALGTDPAGQRRRGRSSGVHRWLCVGVGVRRAADGTLRGVGRARVRYRRLLFGVLDGGRWSQDHRSR